MHRDFGSWVVAAMCSGGGEQSWGSIAALDKEQSGAKCLLVRLQVSPEVI